MHVRFRRWNELDEQQRSLLLARSEQTIEEILPRAERIVSAVRERGDQALLEFTRTYDCPDCGDRPIVVTPEEFEEARRAVSGEVAEAIDYAVENVRAVHQAQLPERLRIREVRPGLFVGERSAPIESVGLYVPRGRGSFPSMLYMLAVPASIAGVPNLCAASPPGPDGSIDPAVLYAAAVCGVRTVYRMGGAQAVAALAFGTESVGAVDKIVGPGSAWVAAAKRLVRDRVDTGLPAGPSESMILADAGADPRCTAMDLLIEAEHGEDSQALLVTDSERLAAEVCTLLADLVSQTPEPRQGYLRSVLSGYGGVLLVDSMDEGVGVVNRFAPEHLQLRVTDPWSLFESVRHAGEILIGEHSAFSVANYAAGANAVLPTGGAARVWSGVSVLDFLKRSSVVHVTGEGYADVARRAAVLAGHEGFYWHARALRDRSTP